MTEIFKFRGDVYEYDSETKKAHPGDVVHVRIAGGGFDVGTVQANRFEAENFFVENEDGEEFQVWVAAGDRYTVLKPAEIEPCANCSDKNWAECFACLSNNEQMSEPTEDASTDNVNSPRHYTAGRFETIEMIEEIAQGYDDGFLGHCVGTAVKYLSRAPYKHESPVEDLRKAEKYVQFAIERAEKLNNSRINNENITKEGDGNK